MSWRKIATQAVGAVILVAEIVVLVAEAILNATSHAQILERLVPRWVLSPIALLAAMLAGLILVRFGISEAPDQEEKAPKLVPEGQFGRSGQGTGLFIHNVGTRAATNVRIGRLGTDDMWMAFDAIAVIGPSDKAPVAFQYHRANDIFDIGALLEMKEIMKNPVEVLEAIRPSTEPSENSCLPLRIDFEDASGKRYSSEQFEFFFDLPEDFGSNYARYIVRPRPS